jgi:hypothetical protein
VGSKRINPHLSALSFPQPHPRVMSRSARGAFRALVGYPDEAGTIDGATVPDLVMALDAACLALRNDDSMITDNICELLVSYRAPVAAGSYSDAVVFVAYNRKDWREAFEIRCAS